MNRVEIYSKAKEELEAYAKNQNVDITKYYVPTHEKKYGTGINYYFYLFCGHLSDRQYMGNIIKFFSRSSDTQKIMEDVLFHYDPEKTIESYQCAEGIMQEINKRYPGKITNVDKWLEYLTGIYQCANYLVDGRIGRKNLSVDSLLKEPKTVDELKIYLYKLRLIIKNLCGVGTAVCYNWLKECGAVWLAKPDLHIKRVVAEILKCEMKEKNLDKYSADGIILAYKKDNQSKMGFPTGSGINKNSKLYADEYVAVFMWEWSKAIRDAQKDGDRECTAYKLDRVLYLYCTNGRFYLDEDRNNAISEENLLEMIHGNNSDNL